MDDTSVKVAVRVRPQSAKERIDMCQICTQVTPGEPQIVLGKDKAFTFDYVFDLNINQDFIYQNCGEELIDGTFEGYNATIFAYGQTGSGKTYTMGTGFDLNVELDQIGIIPRAVEHLFNGIEDRKCRAATNNEPMPDFKVNAQFMELYNEEIIDLLDTTRDPSEKGRKSHIRIHEDASGGIYTVGVTTRPVQSLQDTMQCLKMGALLRTTASTNMNVQSSRSHAIFTLHIRQQRLAKVENDEEDGKERDSTEGLTEFEMLSAKFHFVDLAGSERLKRTGATGERAKEGISINCGLLALGNVISALGDKAKRGMHVPYRDSKLTRLLQDSLGGNSRTMMIACISPSDRDFIETLNTLKYANRARNIKNRVMVNQDKTSKQISALRMEIQALQAELLEYKMGKRVFDVDGVENGSDLFHETGMLQNEVANMKQRVKVLQDTVESLTLRNIQLLADHDAILLSHCVSDNMNEEAKKLIEVYIKEMEELRARLVETEALVEAMKRSMQRMTPSRMSMSPMGAVMSASNTSSVFGFNVSPDDHIQDLISVARKDVKKLKRKCKLSSKSDVSDDEKKDNEENDVEDEVAADQVIDEDEEDEDEDEEDDDQSDNESDADELDSDVVTGKLKENLADLTCEISIKQKLIEELELSQKRLHTLKVQYEDKLTALENKIRETQLERDQVLASLGNVESQSDEKAKKVREEYERKLTDMQNELKKLEAAKHEHSKMIRNQSHYEKQFKSLQHDLSEMKKLKVQLMNKIKEEAQKSRQVDIQRSREINQLKKEQRLKDSQIKTLEAEKKQKELVLKRKQEEVESLRRRQRPTMSAKVAGQVAKYDKEPTVPINPVSAGDALKAKRPTKFNSKSSKVLWDNLEKSLSSIVIKKQTIGHMEKDMERWMKQREHLGKKLDKLVHKKGKASNMDQEASKDLTDQIESVRDNISYIQDNINECQSNIMQMEEGKEDEIDPATLFSKSSLTETKYLLERCISLIINKGLMVAQKEAESKELLAKLHQERMDSTFQRDMLQYLIQDKVDIEIDDSLLSHRNDSDESDSESDSNETTSQSESQMSSVGGGTSPTHVVKRIFDEMLKTQLPATQGSEASTGGGSTSASFPPSNGCPSTQLETVGASNCAAGGRPVKARRKTATAEELLFAGGMGPAIGDAAVPNLPTVAEVSRIPTVDNAKPTATVRASVNSSTRDTVVMPPPKTVPPTRTARQNGTSSHHPRLESIPVKSESGSNVPRRVNSAGMKPSCPPDPSPLMRRKVLSSSISSGSGSLSKLSSVSDMNTADLSPPSSPSFGQKLAPVSPSMNRKLKEQGNVFSRLTSRTQPASPHPTRGVINTVPSKTNQVNQSFPLVHCFTAIGHSKAVLSACATDEMLFTSSKDRTAKVWDLQTGAEMLTLTGHPNNVVSVKYSEETSMVYSVSTYLVKVWDPRQGNTCIKMLTSAGLTNESTIPSGVVSRQATCPPGEINITDIALNSAGTVLYSAAGNTVRIWDMRMYKSVGKLSGGHQAAVMALAIDDTDTADGNICVVTGSKDHYIKVFEVMEDSVGVICPKYNLEPPHYDGIQSLCLMGDLLFSGSRDTCIKKWDLAEQQLKQSINNAHKDWICGLTFLPSANCLLSGCRAGVLKVWHVDNCTLLGEIQAHNSPINSICANSEMLFSASNDKSIHFWRCQELINSLDTD